MIKKFIYIMVWGCVAAPKVSSRFDTKVSSMQGKNSKRKRNKATGFVKSFGKVFEFKISPKPQH